MRKKILFSLIAFFLVLVLYHEAFAQNSSERAKGQEDKGPLTKITFIHYKKGTAKGGPSKPKPSTSTCYSYLSNGAKWRTVEPYLVNAESSNLDSSFVLQAVSNGVSEWEKYAGDVFGPGELTLTETYDGEIYDDKNVASFGPFKDPNIIAVTTVWGYFGGSPKSREIVEWDMLFNTAYNWGDASQNSTLMDLQNIATHELGHSAGMGDLYQTTCNLETMYGYSGEGEITKRDLGPGDIKGIEALY